MAKKRKPKTRGRRGEGSVWFVGENRKRPWRATVLGRSAYFDTRDAAEAWRRAQLNGHTAPAARDRQQVMEALEDLLNDRDWIAPTTRITYDGYMANIVLHIGTRAVGDVTSADIAAMDRALRAKFVGARAAYILGFCATLFRRLMALGTITFDPVAAYMAITPPRARTGKPMRKAVALDAGLCRLVLRELETDPYYVPIAWLMVLGLRSGELKGLRWVNVQEGVASIVEQRRKNDRHTPAPLKTEREIGHGRDVPVPDLLLSITPRSTSDLVCPNPRDGLALPSDVLGNHLRAACARAGVRIIRPHDLRHTCATGLEMLGCSKERRDALLGHAGKDTGDNYTHIGVETLRPWVDQWAAQVLGGASELRIPA